MTASRRASARLQRRFPRLTLRVDVEMETPAGRIAATATTLGAGGLFVTTAAPFAEHAPLVVRFRLPGEETELCLRAHIAWTRANGNTGIGIAFDDADARRDLAGRLERWAELRDPARSGADGL